MKVPKPVILHLHQDDPKKCSARKMARFERAIIVEKTQKLPYGSLLLDPFSQKALSPADRKILLSKGIVAVDCSWQDAESVFNSFRDTHRMENRSDQVRKMG